LELLPNINVNVRINSTSASRAHRPAARWSAGRPEVSSLWSAQRSSVGKATPGKREIRVGIADATNYESGGLQEGEMVALPGDVDLKDGMPVKIVNTMRATSWPK